MMRFLMALLRAIFSVLSIPVRLLGWQPQPTAAALAAAALADIEDDDDEPEPAPEDDTPLPLPTFHAPLGHRIKDHVRRQLGDKYALLQTPPDPLPTDVAQWLSRMDDAQLQHVINLSAWQLQEHVLAGRHGVLHSLGYCLPQPAARPTGYAGSGDRDGRSGKGGGPANLQAVLEGMGYSPSYGPRPR